MSVTTVPSFCRICTAGCGTMLTIGDDNEIIGVRGDPDNKLSNGYACFKGLQAEESHHGPERLLHPLKRQPDGSYARIGLEQALDEIAAKIDAIIRRGGLTRSPPSWETAPFSTLLRIGWCQAF